MIARTPPRQRGVALVTALLIVAMAAAIATSLNLSQQIWLRQIQNLSDRAQADSARHAALDGICMVLEDDGKKNQTDNLTEGWAKEGAPWDLNGAGTARFGIEDAQGRFNLNSVIDMNGNPNVQNAAVFEQMLNLLGLDSTLKEKLLDWVDIDNMTSPNGADDTDYLALKKPHRAANQKLASVDELRLIMGFDEETVETLRPYVVALPESDTKININTAPDVVLAAFFAGMTLEQAQALITLRNTKPFTDTGQISALLPPGVATTSANFDVRTSYFIVKVDVTYGRFRRKTISLVHRDVGRNAARVLWHYQEYPKLPKDDDNT